MNFETIPSGMHELEPAQIAASLPFMTRAPIIKARVEKDLRDRRLAWFGASSWKGPIAELIDNDAVDAELRAGVDFFLGFLRATDDPDISTNRYVDPESGEADYVEMTWSILQGLKQVSAALKADVITGTKFDFGDSDIDRFYGYGGGRIWRDEDLTTITTAKNDFEAEDKFTGDWGFVYDKYIAKAEISNDHETAATKLDEAAAELRSRKA